MATTQRLGHYTIVRKLGEGGMGAVYEAVQDGLNRRVALKVLPKHLMSDATYLERFRREAQASAALKHPNIVTVYEIGEDRGLHYFSMEFVDGESLQKRLSRDSRIPVPEALNITARVAEALDYAWNHGQIVHRDIKPDNIMITREGYVLLADLGLARSVQENIRLTQTGVPIGSPAFMSPEQAESAKDADCRADIYSLGITLYDLITGDLPFKGPTALSVILAHEKQPLPDPRVLNPAVSEGVCQLLERMCAKDPAQRFQTPAELLEALERLGVGPSFHRQTTVASSRGAADVGAAPASAPAPAASRLLTSLTSLRSRPRAPLIAASAGAFLVLVAVVLLAVFFSPDEAGPGPKPPPESASNAAPASSVPSTTATLLTTTSAASVDPTPGGDRFQRTFEEALRFAQNHPQDFDESIRNFTEIEAAAPGTEYAIKAREQRLRLAKAKEADNAFKKLRAATGELTKADRFGDALQAVREFPEEFSLMVSPEALGRLEQSVGDAAQKRFNGLQEEANRLAQGQDYEGARQLCRQAAGFGIPSIQKSAEALLQDFDRQEQAAADRVLAEAQNLYNQAFEQEVNPLIPKHQYARALERLEALAGDPRFEALGAEAFDSDRDLIRKAQGVLDAAGEAARRSSGRSFSFHGRKGIAMQGKLKRDPQGGFLLALGAGGEIAFKLEDLTPQELADLAASELKKRGGEGSLQLAVYWMFHGDLDQGRQALEAARAEAADTARYEPLFAEPAAETPATVASAEPPGEAPAETPAENRAFLMGFSTFPSDAFSLEAVEKTYQLVAEHGELVAYQLDEGVPWPQALEKKPYPASVEDGLGLRTSKIKKGQKVYLALSPIQPMGDQPEEVLVGVWGDGGNQERKGEWKNLKIDDPKVVTAYTHFCLDLIQRFQPHYMAYAVQPNELATKQPDQWPLFVNLAKGVYTRVKAKFPHLPLFLTLRVESFWEDEERQTRAIRQVLPYTDFIALGSYGGTITRFADPSKLPADFFSKIADLAPEKPFAIAETGYIAEDLHVYGWIIEGREEWQQQYLEFVLQESQKRRAQFVVWFFSRDYDAFWEQIDAADPLKEFLKIFRDTGLWDGHGNPRKALETWNHWRGLPISP